MTISPTATIKQMNEFKRSDVELRLQLSVPQAGIFTLGVSTLNGSDVLGDAYQWDVYDTDLVEVSLNRRNDVTSGIFFRAIANSASIVIRDASLDPNNNPYIHPNTKAKVDYRLNGGAWTNYISGYITQVDSIYSYDAGILVQFEIEDMMTRFLNAPIDSFSEAGGTWYEMMNIIVYDAFTSASLTDSVYTASFSYPSPASDEIFSSQFGALDYANTSAENIINDLMDAELGLLFFDGTVLRAYPRDWAVDTVYEANTTDFSSFRSGYSSDYLFSDIYASLASAPTVVLHKQNTDVAAFFGAIVQNYQLKLNSNSELEAWMASVVARSPGLAIQEFSIPRFVPMKNNHMTYIVNDFVGKTEGIYQSFVDSTIYLDATSVSTSMTLYQPV